MGYYANRINCRRNFHNNQDFSLKSSILYNIEKQKLTIIRNNIDGQFT